MTAIGHRSPRPSLARARATIELVVRHQTLARRSALLIAVVPVVLLVVFADHAAYRHTVVGSGNIVALVTAHLAAYVGITAMTGAGIAVAEDRHRGWLRTLSTVGVAPSRWYFLARALGALVLGAAGLLVLDGIALWLGAQLPLADWLCVDGVALLGGAVFAQGALAIGAIGSPTTASQLASVAAFVLEFAGGVFVPLSTLPELVRQIGVDTPAAAIVSMALTPFYGAKAIGHAVVVLGAWELAFAIATFIGYHRARGERAG
ncbi:ABC-2 type transporter [Acidimicrobium ferrooxidans DSM 10331]|uniref:ABC-2 type transporter n=1 Tax=Acidimicrobium ferrooxidans (strain DSM 10331 / JCM 15462 / NBRC 103882 / ICP) TaxID=525909 RepID=C7M2R8_ACIFD|nr:ABC transporter permease [Acidimicrobium ferrooxidans]ACU53312.1 ABC-2 type transporter [Acidimicrobium ferrooxidans DSM 10331]